MKRGKRPHIVAWDTWAFLEVALGGRRSGLVVELSRQVDVVVTTRDVLVETHGALVCATRSSVPAGEWLESALDGALRVIDPPFQDLVDLRRGTDAALSLADLSLTWAAREAGATEVATEDGGFRAVGLTPVFSRR